MKNKLIDAVLHSDVGAIRKAVASGVDLNEIENGMTPLLFAIYRGDLDVVRLLLDNGADPNLRPDPSDPSHSPLRHAEDDFGLTTVAELLKSYGATK